MKKIVVIQFKQVGDVLITASLFKSLKTLYPNSQLDYIVYDYTLGVVEDNPYIDNFIVIDEIERSNPLKLYYKFLKLRRNKYDYTIDMIGDVKSAILTTVIGAKNKIVRKKNKTRNKLFYNIRVENSKTNTCEARNFLIEGIEKGNFDKIKNGIEVEIFLKKEEILKLKKRMNEKNVNFSRPVVAFGINSRREFKKWDLTYFIQVIEYMIKKYDMQIIFFGAQSELEFIELAKSKITKQDNVFTNIYTESIKDLACLFKNCDMYIGNEGGPRHIAETVKTPTFSVAYTTHNKENWILNKKTWGKTNRMIQIDDYLELSKEEFKELKNSIKRDREKEIKEFKKLKPEYVIEQIEEMIKEFKADEQFRSDIKWLN